MESVFVAVIVAFVAASIIVGAFVRARRRRKTQAFAESRGWGYAASDVGVIEDYPGVFPFADGVQVASAFSGRVGLTLGNHLEPREARDVIHLSWGNTRGHSFTCQYRADADSDGDRTKKVHNWHVVGLELPAPLPFIGIRRRRRIGGFRETRGAEIAVVHEPFAARYTVHSDDPRAAAGILTPDVAGWVAGADVPEGVVLAGRYIFIYARGHQKVERIDPFLAVLGGILERVPATAWRGA